VSELRIYRRRLPHWRLGDAIYCVTWRLDRGLPELDAVERDVVLSSLLHFHRARYLLYAGVVMNDHVHVLFEALGRFQVEELIHTWKSFTANRLQKAHRTGRIWQPEYWDRIIRDEREFDEAVGYIVANPYLRWPGIDSYPWIWIDAAAYD